MQREHDGNQMVIGEYNQIQSLHGEAEEAEKKLRQAAVVGNVAIL